MNLLNQKSLTAKINSIRTRSTKLDNDIHLVACSALNIFVESGNTTNMMLLVNALGRSANAGRLSTWFKAHAPIVDGKSDSGTRSFKKIKDAENTLTFGIQVAIDNPFWNDSEEKEVKLLDVSKLLKTTVSRLTKAIETNTVSKGQREQAVQLRDALKEQVAS